MMPARTDSAALLVGVGDRDGLLCRAERRLPARAAARRGATSTRIAADAARRPGRRRPAPPSAVLVIVSSLRRAERHHPRRPACVLRDGAGRPAPHVDRPRPPAYRTPSCAIAAQAICGRRAGSRPAPTGTLFARVIYTEWIFFALMAAGLFVLRRRARLCTVASAPGAFRSSRRLHRGVAGDRPQSDLPSSRARPPSGSASSRSVCRFTISSHARHRLSQSLLSAGLPRALPPRRRRSVRVTVDNDGNPYVHYPGDYNVAVPGPSRSRLPRRACSTSTASTRRSSR